MTLVIGATSITTSAVVTTAAASAGAATPAITSVLFRGSSSDPTIVIKGAGFGTAPTPAGSTDCLIGSRAPGNFYASHDLYFKDFTSSSNPWAAGLPGYCPGLIVIKYTDTKIKLKFGDFYYGPTTLNQLYAGDQFKVGVYGISFGGTVAYS